jgi:chorismate mutase
LAGRSKKITGLPITVEVATAKHVQDALQFDVDILWIGARSTVNPFSIQEIADALRGIDIPVLIKNPINPDLELWSGGIERLQKAGLAHIGMIHRGFSSYGNTEFRNAPMWHLPIEMKRRFPGLPLICDPSHICGTRHLLQSIAQKSIDLDFDGIMMESHIDPDNAWSDAKQQVTPERLAEILENLVWRHENTDEKEFITALATLREQINQLDDELITLLGQRMKIADKIGAYKSKTILLFYKPIAGMIFSIVHLKKEKVLDLVKNL